MAANIYPAPAGAVVGPLYVHLMQPSQEPSKVSTIIISPTSQIRKLRHREIKLAPGHVGIK